MKLSKAALVLLLAPALLAACTVRHLADGSYTTCQIGNPCQVGPQGAMKTPGPMMHSKHHHHVVVKKDGKVVAKPVVKGAATKSPRTDDTINAK